MKKINSLSGNFKDAQHLTREQMKKVMGGILAPTVDTVECNDGTSHALPSGDCSLGSSGQCNDNGGVKDCVAYGHPNPQ
jgi:hypothetical protein